jgi:TRAP-type C4-dicarboxylate transport system substrate-binding protein
MQRRIGVLAVTAWLASTSALAQQVTIRWSDVVPATHPSVQMIERIAAEAKEKSGGPHRDPGVSKRQLGSSRDTIDATANGVQQIVTEGAANFGAWVPSISIVEAPYIWRDAAHLDKVMNGPIGEQFNDTLVKSRGMRILGTTYYGHTPYHDVEQGSEDARRHGGAEASRSGE